MMQQHQPDGGQFVLSKEIQGTSDVYYFYRYPEGRPSGQIKSFKTQGWKNPYECRVPYHKLPPDMKEVFAELTGTGKSVKQFDAEFSRVRATQTQTSGYTG